MKRLTVIPLLAALVVVSFMGGAWWNHRGATTPSPAVLYACPMHPEYRADRPGDCPACGMRLEPVRAQTGSRLSGDDGARSLPPGAVQVSPERQQAIGVHLGLAERLSGTHTLRTTGRVAANENATYPLVSGVDARVRDVRSPTAGTLVRKNEVLASLYAPELLNTTQGYLIALNAVDNLGRQATPDPNQAQAANANRQRAEETLRNLGVSEGQIEKLRATRQSTPTITIASPVDGFILQRNLLVGQRVERGTELYRVADLRRVWIFADVYENQMPFIRPGAGARLVSAQQNRRFVARVSDAQPIFDEAARTLKVRLEADNPGLALKPGMFVDVEFDVVLPPSLAVPADAIVDTGLRKTLFVDRGQGFFEPRQVETGWRIGDQVEVTRGLMPGERIVLSGTFLIDSESRMGAAARGIRGASATDPACGMEVDEKSAAAAGRKSDHGGKTFYFCSDECKKSFDADPARYAKK